jgi:Ca-activated chloride channel family protein
VKAPARSLWHALPKPVVFGIWGALGGLVGATAFGEAVWWALRPKSPVVVSAPPLRLAASAAIELFQGGTNRLSVKIAREGFAEPVTVKALDPPAGVRIDPIVIPADRTEFEVQVSADADAPAGSREMTLKAVGPARPESPQALVTTRLTIRKTLPPPPALRLSVSPEVVVEQSSKNRFGVLIARDHFTGPVTLELDGLTNGVTATGLTVPADVSKIEVELDAAAGAAVGTANVSVTATGPRGPAEAPGPPVAMSRFSLTVNPPRRQTGVDVMFVLDVTGSMQAAINGIRDGIIQFAQELEKRKLDARVGLVAFRDRLNVSADLTPPPRMPSPKGRVPARAGRKRGRGDAMPPAEPPVAPGVSEEPFLINVAGEVFTRDYAEFGREVGRKLVADGGGDTPESALDGLALAARQTFRPGATRVLILITDAPPKVPDKEIQSVDEVAGILRENKIDQLHLVINNPYREIYNPLQKDSPGTTFDLQDAVHGRDAFASLLPTVSREIARITTASQPAVLESAAATRPPTPVAPPAARAQDLPPIAPAAVLGGVQSQEKFAAESSGRLLLAIAAWTAMITAMIAMALCAGQHHYLKEGLLPVGAALRSWLGGSLAGLAGGAAGQLLYLAAAGGAASEAIFRVLGWTLLGALAGVVLAFFVPNLRSARSSVGGALGGAAGALGFLGVAIAIRGMPAADPSGRILGATLLGSALGLTLALAERIARKAWLEICYGGCEIRTVNLGLQPVSIGSDMHAATVYARGLAPVAYRYSFAAGKVIRQDAATNELTELRPGEPQSVGAVTVTLRTAAWATAKASGPSASSQPSLPPRPTTIAAGPSPAPPASPPSAVRQPSPPPRPVATGVTTSTTSSPAVAAVAPRPASAAVTAGATSQKPAASATNSGNCPSCGRPVPGVPGRRYCIHCDLYL